MKKSVVIAVLGLAVGAVSSFGQGAISFNSYFANGSLGFQTMFSGALGSSAVGAGYSADLLYSLTPISDVAGNGSLTPGWIFSGAGAPSVNNVITPFGTTPATLGYFQSPANFMLNPYTAGTTVYFEVIAYQTAAGSYDASLAGRGHSAEFSATLAVAPNLPGFVSFTPFTVSPAGVIPEPTTLALAGLGGLSLLLFRRKQS
jgi:hypothetical protein